jgi:hypothetical protein
MQNEMIVKHLNFGSDAQGKVFNGIQKLTKAVAASVSY